MSNHSTSGPKKDPFERVLERYNALPRSGRWVAIAVVALGGFMLLDSVLWPIADGLNRRADRLELALTRAADRAEGLPDEVVEAAVAHGPNQVPLTEKAGKERLAAAVAEILKKKNISAGQDVRPAQPLPASVMGGSMAKSVAEIRFEGTPDAVLSVLTELDASPAIDAISDVRLNYNTGTKRVGVQLSVEKWGTVQKTARGGA